MTQLLQSLRDELVRRDYAATTIRSYVQIVDAFRHNEGAPQWITFPYQVPYLLWSLSLRAWTDTVRQSMPALLAALQSVVRSRLELGAEILALRPSCNARRRSARGWVTPIGGSGCSCLGCGGIGEAPFSWSDPTPSCAERQMWPQLPFRAHAGETPRDHRATDAAPRSRLARPPSEGFWH